MTQPLVAAALATWAAVRDRLPPIRAFAGYKLGPGSGLTRLVRDRYPDLPSRSVEEFRSVDGAVAWAVNATAP